jgi:hypothetical protein
MNSGNSVQVPVLASAAATGPLPVPGLRWQLGPKASAALVVMSTAALATFTLEGRISTEAPWVPIMAANATLAGGAGQAFVAIAQALPEMRLNWTGNAGAVTAWVMA